MTQPTLKTILHVSDFHFAKRRLHDQKQVVEALIADLKELCVGHRKPDVILFTGDLVYAAGHDSHDEAYDLLLGGVSKVTGCSDERIFITPGNHDVMWSGIDSFKSKHREWKEIIGSPKEQEKLNELYSNNEFNAAIEKKLLNYNDLNRYIRSSSPAGTRRYQSAFATVDYIQALNFDIVTLNSAAFSTGGHRDFGRDETHLAFPEHAVLDAVEHLTGGSYRIFLIHHPLHTLSETSSRMLRIELEKNANMLLFGHMHDPVTENVIGLNGQNIRIQAGGIFTSKRDYYNGYLLVTLDTELNHSEILVRSYMKDRNVFDQGIDVVAGGSWHSSHAARQHFHIIARPVDENKFREHLSTIALKELEERFENQGEISEIRKFVLPPMEKRFIQQAPGHDGKTRGGPNVDFDEIFRSDENFIIYGRSEYGKTAALRQLCYEKLKNVADIDRPRLPVTITFNDVGYNTDSLLRKLRAESVGSPTENGIDSLLKLGYLSVAIDDVIFSDTRRMKVLREFVSLYPKAQYLFTSPHSSATKFGACIDPEMPVRFEFVELMEFRRKDMRQLLARDERCHNVEEWLDRLQSEFKEINLPFTAANGSMLIEILSEKHNFSPINRAVLMEQFVDSTLRKAAVEQSRRDIFDYTNKTDMLAHIAAWMAVEDRYSWPREAVRQQMKDYLHQRGLKVELDALLSEFLTSRILVVRPDGNISFRYKGVLEYFIALRMATDRKFRDWVLEDNRYLTFINEINYYAGKLRNDSDLVELIAKRHQEIIKKLEIDHSDLAQFESISLPEDNGSVDAAAFQVTGAPLSKEEKDAELELELPADGDDRQDVVRVQAASDDLVLSIILYSGMIKNMELISDSDKRRHLHAIWRGWAMMMIEALRIAPKLAKERRLRINGALYEVHAPQGMNDTTLLRQMLVSLPHVYIRWISNSVGSEKLEEQLTNLTLEELADPKIVQLLRAGLVADLRLSETPASVKRLFETVRGNKFLLWSMIVHMAELRRLDKINRDHFLTMSPTIAGAIAEVKGGSRSDRASEKRRQITLMAKDRLMLKIKAQSDKRQNSAD